MLAYFRHATIRDILIYDYGYGVYMMYLIYDAFDIWYMIYGSVQSVLIKVI